MQDEREGLFVSPFPVKSRLENFRGIYLPYRNNREYVIAIVRNYAPDLRGLPQEQKSEKDDADQDQIEIDQIEL